MKPKNILSASITSLLLIMTQCNAQNYPSELDQLVRGASFIFRAKIALMNTVTTDEENVSGAGVAKVTEVIDAPLSLRHIAGQQITVRFSEGTKPHAGEERIFFTEPYWIGESLGVTEKGSIMKGDKLYDSKEISSYIRQARAKQDDEQLKNLLDSSKLVVTGKVIKINIPKGYIRMATEHDPEWREAEIQTEEILKGKTEGKMVRILFASSKDLMFLEAPKLKAGDEGIFITQTTDPTTAKLLQNEYMLLEHSSFLKGKEKIQKIRSLLR